MQTENLQETNSEVYSSEMKRFFKEATLWSSILTYESKLSTNTGNIIMFLEENLKRAVYDIKIHSTRRSLFRLQRLQELIYTVIQESVYEQRKIKDPNMNADLFQEIYKLKNFDFESRKSISLGTYLAFDEKSCTTSVTDLGEVGLSFAQKILNFLMITQNNLACHYISIEKNTKAINIILRCIEVRKIELRRNSDYLILAILFYN